MAEGTITCPHCKEEVEDFVVTGDVEVLYNLDSREYRVDSVADEKYLCSICYEDCSEVVFTEVNKDDDDDAEKEVIENGR
ncbi:MAG: hypothetical protein DDT23_01314 [candidate division WS2 bacterium]|nr:hypothetical protein [Candidatus Lithacetigena glycinireducens]